MKPSSALPSQRNDVGVRRVAGAPRPSAAFIILLLLQALAREPHEYVFQSRRTAGLRVTAAQLGGAALGPDPAPVDDHDLVADRLGLLQIVSAQDHGGGAIVPHHP